MFDSLINQNWLGILGRISVILAIGLMAALWLRSSPPVSPLW